MKPEAKEKAALSPHWPDGLEMGKHYRFLCDDKGADGGTYIQVCVAQDGDCHISAQEWPDFKEAAEGSRPMSFPSIRCRTGIGGGRHRRTRQALLWLARAIALDNEELGLDNYGEPKPSSS